ncbi:MAG: Ig domain-containing protein [Lachnospiraceae bacterium]|nr:Ig domain-containing protein [Lachnospiraceae bacterium]
MIYYKIRLLGGSSFMKKIGTGIKLFVCLLFTAVIVYSNGGKAFAAEFDPASYSMKIDDKKITDNTVYDLGSSSVKIKIADKEDNAPDTEQVDITWETSVPNVVSIKAEAKKSEVTLKREAPGYSTITATLKESGTETILGTYRCKVKIDFAIDYDAMGIDKDGILVLDKNSTKQVQLKYTDNVGTAIPVSIYADAFLWNTDNVLAASVNTAADAGKVTAVGGGFAKVNVKAANGDQDMIKSLKVAVKPSFALIGQGVAGDSTSLEDPVFSYPDPISVPLSEFYIDPNTSNVDNLHWVVKEGMTGEVIYSSASSSNSNRMKVKPSDGGSRLFFSSVKAGTYDIIAYADKSLEGTTGMPYAYMRILVPIAFHSYDIVMSVNDVYKIMDNSNIPSLSVLDTDSLEDPNPKKILKYYSADGSYKAMLKGVTTLHLEYNEFPSLYPAPYNSTVPKQFDIKVTVIDKIALNRTSAAIYEDGTLLLDAIVSDEKLSVEWYSSDETLATVAPAEEGNDKRAVVTALKPTKAGEPVIITAKLMDDHGVVKSVTCEVTIKRAVSSIVIDPSSVVLHVGDTEVLDAVITPAELNGITPLHWESSDESIVSLTKYNNSSVKITGKKAGRATITAIDQNNVVVGYCQVIVYEPVVSIELSEKEIVTDLSTKYLQLKTVFTPANATNQEVTWFSTNEKIATVDKYGVVSIKAAGKVSIVATSVDNPSAKAICNITIDTPAMSLTMEETEKTMKVGETAQLSYVLLPMNATNQSVVWASSNPSIVEVDAKGKVTAKGKGTAVIILKSMDYGLSAYCTIKVDQTSAKDAGYKFDVTELQLKTGDTYEIKVTFQDSDLEMTDLRWESTDTGVASVDHYGKVKAKNPGVVTISARVESGAKVTCKVTVVKPVENILLNFTEKAIRIGDKFDLDASVSPSDATNQKITWVSSNPDIATVNKNGLVEGLTAGIAKITAKVEGETITATCVVTVNEDATGLEINHINYRLGLGDKVTLKAIITPEYASKNVKWTSSNEKVASVNSKGKVVGISYGFATIKAITKDGTELEASCEIEVVKPVQRVLLDKGSISMMAGESKKLKATISPKNATYNTINWTSSDDSIAMVDENGVVTALKAGKVSISASAEDGSSKKAVCIVNIRAGIPATGVTAMNKKITMVPGEKKTVKVVLNPVNSTDGITWSSDNSSVASVDRKTGSITARATGTANITVMTDNGKTAIVEVNVIGLNFTDLTIEQYTNYDSYLIVEGTSSKVNWSIDNPSIARITKVGNSSLRISSRAIGKATITATVDGRKLKCRITVKAIR